MPRRNRWNKQQMVVIAHQVCTTLGSYQTQLTLDMAALTDPSSSTSGLITPTGATIHCSEGRWLTHRPDEATHTTEISITGDKGMYRLFAPPTQSGFSSCLVLHILWCPALNFSANPAQQNITHGIFSISYYFYLVSITEARREQVARAPSPVCAAQFTVLQNFA